MTEYLACWLAGVILGVLVTVVVVCVKSAIGVLRIDESNPEKKLWRFDVRDLDEITTKKYIILQVDKYANLSQK